MERIYRVSFFKTLTDSTGHPVDACQGAVEVRATSQGRAIELARLRFAELKDVSVWSMRADYEKAELLPARKRVSSSAWRNSQHEHSAAHY
jgi:hypothetical protein